jgi:hypothetical protein
MLHGTRDLLGRASQKKRITMKRIFVVVVLLLSASAAFATSTTQKWTAGWNIFSEPLNYTTSKISWSVNTTTSKLSVTFTLRGATPNKIYQVGMTFFCTTFPSTFGQFPTNQTSGGKCEQFTEQGVTETVAYVAVGVVTTDLHGNGSFAVVVGPIASGTYNLEFNSLDGAGCFLAGGANGAFPECEVAFQSPGPTFGDATTITIP